MRLVHRLLALTLIAMMLVQPVAVFAGAAGKPSIARLGKPYIHWALLNPEEYKKLVEKSWMKAFEKASEDIARLLGVGKPKQVYRVLILAPPDVKPVELAKLLRGKVAALGWIARLPSFTLAYALVRPSDIPKLADTPGLLAVLPDVSLDFARPPVLRKAMVGGEYRAKPLHASGAGGLPYHETVYITKAAEVWKTGNRGQLAKIAIIDTGVDYATPALGVDAIARDEYGRPLILEDAEGLLLFSVTAEVVNSSYIWVNTSKVYVWFNDMLGGYVAKTEQLVYDGPAGSLAVNMTQYWRIPARVYEAYERGGAPPRFGVLVETVYLPAGWLVFSVPALAVDLDADGLYDAIYFDMSTAYNLTMYVLGLGTAYGGDFSFADEKPVRYGDEIAARDFNGDGYPDFSVGTLAGYFYDAYGVALLQASGQLEKIIEQQDVYYPGYDFVWPTWDYVGLILPGFDVKHGTYAAIHYDFYSHGTFCATTAAGRPVPGYTGYGYEGFTLVAGQAPEAKIASANALFAGDVAAALFFFSGFDEYLYNPETGEVTVVSPIPPDFLAWMPYGYIIYWSYTGKHQVDITSNSWGVSAWALWGWASGLGPLETVIDYTSSISGTAHFVAAGNGGPGWGTVTVPAAAATAVTVGAATEFTYRPIFGYLIGGNREVISWSDRGPAESGLAKPDVVAIGSFAFAVGRIWESYRYGVLDGYPALLVDLFSGTSQATPMAAGVAALVVTAYKQLHGGRRMPAWMLKTIMMNAAADTGFDPFSQGAGFVDAAAAVEFVKKGVLVYNPYFRQQAAELGISIPGEWKEPKVVVLSPPGRVARFMVAAEGIGYMPRAQVIQFVRTGLVRYRVSVDLSKADGFAPYPILYLDPAKLARHKLVQIRVYFPYWYFAAGRSGAPLPSGARIDYAGIELWYWVDLNRNGVMEPGETARITYDIRGGNYLTIQVGNLAEQLETIRELNAKYLGIDISRYPGKLVLILRLDHGYSSGTLPLTVTLEFYDPVRAGYARSLVLRGKAYLVGYVYAPRMPGVYEYYMVVESSLLRKPVLIPVTLIVYKDVGYSKVTLQGTVTRLLYENYLLKGAQDWTWRYESGDWRVFFVRVTSPQINMLVVDVYYPVASKKDYTSNVDVQVYGPKTIYLVELGGGQPLNVISVYKADGVELAGELTLDYWYWWDYPEPGHSRIIVPVEGPGVYRIVVRNIQYSGERLEEPVKIVVTPVIGYTSRASVPKSTTMTQTLYVLLTGAYPGLAVTWVDWTGEAIVSTRTSTLYYYDAASAGIASVASLVTRRLAAYTVVYATMKIDAPRGSKVTLPLYIELNMNVYSIGAFAENEVYYAYEQNWFIALPTVTVR